MTKRMFPPCKRCGGWVYEDVDNTQGMFVILTHVCMNCACEQDSKIIPMVKNQRTVVKEFQNGRISNK